MSLLKCRSSRLGTSKQVICSAMFLDTFLSPCIMVYLGMVEMTAIKGGNGTDSNSKKTQQKKSAAKSKQHQQQMCHALRQYGGLSNVFTSDKEIVDKADELRQMSVEELCKRLEIRRLRDFPAGTVMVYYRHSYRLRLTMVPAELAT